MPQPDAPLTNEELDGLEDLADIYAKKLSNMLKDGWSLTDQAIVDLSDRVKLLYGIVRERRKLRGT